MSINTTVFHFPCFSAGWCWVLTEPGPRPVTPSPQKFPCSVWGLVLMTGRREPWSICSMGTWFCDPFFARHYCGWQGGLFQGYKWQLGNRCVQVMWVVKETNRWTGPREGDPPQTRPFRSGGHGVLAHCSPGCSPALLTEPLPSHSQRWPSHAPCWAGFSGKASTWPSCPLLSTPKCPPRALLCRRTGHLLREYFGTCSGSRATGSVWAFPRTRVRLCPASERRRVSGQRGLENAARHPNRERATYFTRAEAEN